MEQFRKKPVIIDAVQTNGMWSTVSNWLIAITGPDRLVIPFGSVPPITFNDDGSVKIKTLEGVMRADIGDWIIRGVKGEFYPCKPDIFEATYELASRPVSEGEQGEGAIELMINSFASVDDKGDLFLTVDDYKMFIERCRKSDPEQARKAMTFDVIEKWKRQAATGRPYWKIREEPDGEIQIAIDRAIMDFPKKHDDLLAAIESAAEGGKG